MSTQFVLDATVPGESQNQRRRPVSVIAGHYYEQAPDRTPMAAIPPPHLHSTSSMANQFAAGQPVGQQPPPMASLTSNVVDDFVHFITEPDDQDQETTVKWSPMKTAKTEVCTPCNCICFFLAFIFLITALMSGVYYGQRVFKAQFVARSQDFLSNELENSESQQFRQFSQNLINGLDRLFQSSIIGESYAKTEIIALERKRNSPGEMIIHLNIHVSAATKQHVESSDIYLILAEEILNNRFKVFETIWVDHNSIDVQERRWTAREKTLVAGANPWKYKSMFPGMLDGLATDPTPPPRRCGRIDLAYCRFLSYNETSYPNYFNHWNVSSVEDEFTMYKELIDSECYSLAKEFLCNLLQPQCIANRMILPCRDFCIQFYDACHRWLPDKLRKKISCHSFPVASADGDDDDGGGGGGGRCRQQPNCAAILHWQTQHHKICDGIFDCPDGSDELASSCSYCMVHQQQHRFHCGDRQCIPLNLTCDNVKDCRNGADEINCLRLSTLSDAQNGGGSISNRKISESIATVMMTQLNIPNEGYLQAIHKGKHSFVCSDHSSTTKTATSVAAIGNSQMMPNYSLAIVDGPPSSSSSSPPPPYDDNQTPVFGSANGNICQENHFDYPIQCRSGQVFYVRCSPRPRCGINHIPVDLFDRTGGQHQRPGRAWPGYWPWYAQINVNGHYYCDGTLIEPDTVVTQTTCFNHHNQRTERLNILSNNLSITVGTVRVSRPNVEATEHDVRSVYGREVGPDSERLTLLKLTRPVTISNIVRPVCHRPLMADNRLAAAGSVDHRFKCVTLNLNYELDVLQHRPVKIVNIEQCKQRIHGGISGEVGQTAPPLPSPPSSATIEPLFQSSSSNHAGISSSSSSVPLWPTNYHDKLCVEFDDQEEDGDGENENRPTIGINNVVGDGNHNQHIYYDGTLIANNNNNNETLPLHSNHHHHQQHLHLGRHLYCLSMANDDYTNNRHHHHQQQQQNKNKIKNHQQWNFVAIEYRMLNWPINGGGGRNRQKNPHNHNRHQSSTSTPSLNGKNLILFQMLPKLDLN